jgi:hypothetical protein
MIWNSSTPPQSVIPIRVNWAGRPVGTRRLVDGSLSPRAAEVETVRPGNGGAPGGIASSTTTMAGGIATVKHLTGELARVVDAADASLLSDREGTPDRGAGWREHLGIHRLFHSTSIYGHMQLTLLPSEWHDRARL